MTGPVKFCVCLPADQTITLLCRDDDGCYAETTKHMDATLFDEREAAEIAMVAYGDYGGWIEEVHDVDEFRAREDTW